MKLQNRAELLRLDHVRVGLKEGKRCFWAVKGVSFSVHEGRNLGMIGESGCGKTLLCHSILGLLEPDKWETEGTFLVEGKEIDRGRAGVRPGSWGMPVGFIAQDPAGAFDPRMTLGNHFLELAGVLSLNRQELWARAVKLLHRMGIRAPEQVLKSYGFQLSGGMLQRVMIALALLGQPRFLVADEPTTALDVTTQWEILGLLRELKAEFGLTVLIVSHDLRVIRSISDDLCVMYAGYIVVQGPAALVLEHPRHPYTKGLLASRPAFSKKAVRVMEGYPPGIKEEGAGCPFAPRCKEALEQCWHFCPELQTCGPAGHLLRCFRAGGEERRRDG